MRDDFAYDPEDTKKSDIKTFQILRRLFPFILEHKLIFSINILFLLGIVAINVYLPMILKNIIDKNIPQKNYDGIIFSGITYFILFILSLSLTFFQGLSTNKLGFKIIAKIKLNLFEHILKQSPVFFNSYTPGKLLARIENDTEMMTQLFSSVALNILRTFFIFFAILIVMFFNQFYLTLFIFSVLVLILIGSFFSMKYLKKLYHDMRKKYAEVVSFITEYIGATSIIQVFNYRKITKEKMLEKSTLKYKRERVAAYFQYPVYYNLFVIGEILSIAIVFYLGSRQVFIGTMTVGAFVMFIEYVRRIFWPIIEFSDHLVYVQRGLVGAMRVFSIMDVKPSIPEPLNPRIIPNKFKELKFEGISFAYDKNKVLRNISFSVKSGEKIAIVGPSGGGKTTIANLILRFYDPSEGTITLNGTSIKEFTLKDLRSRMSLILQDVFLFPGTISENIKMMDETISDKAMINAAHLSEASVSIEKMPLKYETKVSERGLNLSLGERQLISFARALALDPELIILDEATSSVDPHTEELIDKSMEKMLEGRMAIVIAHRLSTIEKADRILVVKDGEIIEAGTHAELKNKNSFYKELLNMQSFAS